MANTFAAHTAPATASVAPPSAAAGDARQGQAIGAALIACAIASFILLANHPGGTAHSFLEVLQNEAAHRTADAVVHGGFIAILAVELVCFVLLAARLGAGRIAPTAALVFTAIGAAMLSASMTVDGLVVPAIAAKYLAGPTAELPNARALFVLCELLIGALMPMGLAFQAAGTVGWGAAFLARRGAVRIAGVASVLLGGVILAALAASVSALNPLVPMGALAAQALWTIAVGTLLILKRL